jgi:hypothetical protein
MVVGMELRSKVRTARYFTGGIFTPQWNEAERNDAESGLRDWKEAAEETGELVQAENDRLLIIVPGLDSGRGMLSIKKNPIKKTTIDKLVYSVQPD